MRTATAMLTAAFVAIGLTACSASSGPQPSPTAEVVDDNVAVIYFSLTGTTRGLAERIAGVLCDGIRL